jgi:hypothetical protein
MTYAIQTYSMRVNTGLLGIRDYLRGVRRGYLPNEFKMEVILLPVEQGNRVLVDFASDADDRVGRDGRA